MAAIEGILLQHNGQHTHNKNNNNNNKYYYYYKFNNKHDCYHSSSSNHNYQSQTKRKHTRSENIFELAVLAAKVETTVNSKEGTTVSNSALCQRHRLSPALLQNSAALAATTTTPTKTTSAVGRVPVLCATAAATFVPVWRLILKLRKAACRTIQATALTLLVLCLSSWISLASSATAPLLAPLETHSKQTNATATRPETSTQLYVINTGNIGNGNSNSNSSIIVSTSSSSDNDTSVELSAPSYTAFNGTIATAAASFSTYTTYTTPTSLAIGIGNSIGNSSSSSRNTINIGANIGSDVGTDTGTNSVYDLFGAVFGNFTAPPPALETEFEFTLPPLQSILVTVILLSIILGTVVGNVLVCIAVCMVRKLRRPCNYLLVSLALSDLCVAVLVMPMAMLYEVLEKWNFGPLLCDIWVSFDVLCCTASILNLCAISVDRYLAITKPLEYGVKRTPRRMMLCVALVWLAAACISLPPLLILGNEHVDENGEPVCVVCQNFAYQIYATLGSFYIPLAVMLFVYYQIFRAAHRIVLEEKRAQTHLQHALNGTGVQQGHTQLGAAGSGNGQRHSSCGNTSLTYSTCGVLSAHGGGSGGGVSGSSNLLSSPSQKKIRFQLAKEKKASTTLGIIMSAFTICWLPFFILALIRPFVESETTHVPQSLSSLFLWLGYANSLLNPIIYATLNRDFRKPFQAILYFRCSSLNTMMRENYYQDQYGEPPSQRVMLGDERHGARESFL